MSSTFNIYSASAGSGKTYTLAKSYIKLLVVSKYSDQFKNILAITFTNKAVGEMKTRIVDMLKVFSTYSEGETKHPMFLDICKELNISEEHLQEKSKVVLQKIIHNYGAFDISTIDGFTHRVIQTFAFDLKLPVNFEVELDQEFLLNKAVDNLIAKAGTDKKLTQTLVDFAIEKADDDKSWDITYDFNKISKLLVNENDLPFVEKLKSKTLEDFNTLKNQLIKQISSLEIEIVKKAKEALTLINEASLQFDDFNRKSLPNHFKNLADKKFNVGFESQWQTALVEGERLYPSRVSDTVAQTIEALQPKFIQLFTETKELVFQIKFKKAIYKNITPLSVINALQKELQTLKDEENKILISEFNSLISKEIKGQPTPFIYERLGEKFRHYFIDEFQDTSAMQWNNLVSLMDNALSAANGSAMLVGDAKQSIYRWRGGDAQQFIDLTNGRVNPFQLKANTTNLETNYRSFKEIINFNNSFFKFVSDYLFEDENYKSLYKGATQKVSKEESGYVNLSFLEYDNAEEGTEVYTEKTLETVKSCIENGYKLGDICVLVRKKKEGIAVSDVLSNHGISIISSETLLLNNSPKVQLLNFVLALLTQPNDQKLKLNVLNAISKLFKITDKHTFFKAHINLPTDELFKQLNILDIQINYPELLQMPIFDTVESLVRSFKLCETSSDAYVQFYLDTVLDYSNKQNSDLSGFLDYFETKKEKLSISTPSNLDAVSVMTIHKSKGLEFPVVIFPFADLDFYKEIEPKEWFPIEQENYNSFDTALINYNKDFLNFGEIGEFIYQKHQSELELDGVNLLYVTLTRAVEQLYIITKKDISAKGVINDKTYAGLFIQYLINQSKWNESQTEYSFGQPSKLYIEKKEEMTVANFEFISTPKESHNLKVITNSGVLWETEQEKALEYGNLVHLVMSKIKTVADVDSALKSVISSGQISSENIDSLQQIIVSIVSNPTLSKYFTDEYEIFNEKDIITKDGFYLRPDRLVIKGNKAIIIDYKTGSESTTYNAQIESYANVLKAMNYEIEKKLIVYTNNPLKISEVK
ncbi:UvrD-helicase domain-containing protein [Winogradskyella litorisediminis]|uniref:DNA 3'-5' helicase n=1 Tax=Winogradskyella litorisediminis TaxID=1156618 RepID=A0ABW3N810_9FLAO